ncbi:MAG: MFS transporter [Candidatus Thermoplasmatota archaeon]
MTRRAFAGLFIIEVLLAFGNTFAGSFNIVYLYNEMDMPLWAGPTYLCIGFGIAILVSLWMSWRPRMDPRNAMVFGLACLIVEYSAFLLLDDGWVIGAVVGVAFGLFYPFFWTPFNILMAQMTQKNDRGVKYGVFFFVWPLAAFFAPFLGGLVIGFINYMALFAIGIGIIVATAVTIVAYRDYIPKDQVMRIRLGAIGRRNVVALLGEGGFEGVFWVDVTLVAYTFSQDEVSLGVLFSLFGLSAGIMGIILGKLSDRIQNRGLFLKLSALGSIPCIVLIWMSGTLEEYALTNGLLEFASFVLPVFLFAILTDKLEEEKNDSVVTREYLLDMGRAASIAALIALLYLGATPQECFLLAIPFLVMVLVAHEPGKEGLAAAAKRLLRLRTRT